MGVSLDIHRKVLILRKQIPSMQKYGMSVLQNVQKQLPIHFRKKFLIILRSFSQKVSIENFVEFQAESLHYSSCSLMDKGKTSDETKSEKWDRDLKEEVTWENILPMCIRQLPDQN